MTKIGHLNKILDSQTTMASLTKVVILMLDTVHNKGGQVGRAQTFSEYGSNIVEKCSDVLSVFQMKLASARRLK